MHPKQYETQRATPPQKRGALTTREMAAFIAVSPSVLDKWRSAAPDNGPPFIRVGRAVRYPLDGPNGYFAWAERQAIGGGLGQ